jgi:nucleotide-binding universal stress UspA family protein
VVVGVDGSPDAAQALDWAAEEARIRGATLEVVYALFCRSDLLTQYPKLLGAEQSVLDSAMARARQLQPTIEVTGWMAEPPAAKALIDSSTGADLLVLGCRGLGGFKQLELGSVSQQCSRHAGCPVAIVRPRRPA